MNPHGGKLQTVHSIYIAVVAFVGFLTAASTWCYVAWLMPDADQVNLLQIGPWPRQAAVTAVAIPNSPKAGDSGIPPEGLNIPFVQTATEIDTSEWKTYEDRGFGFSFQYPASCSVHKQAGQIEISDSAGTVQVTFDVVMSSIPAEVGSHFSRGTHAAQWVGYRIGLLDPTTLAVSLIEFTGSADDFRATYLFTASKNIPGFDDGPKRYRVVRAIAQANLVRPSWVSGDDSWLNPAQQILATVRASE